MTGHFELAAAIQLKHKQHLFTLRTSQPLGAPIGYASDSDLQMCSHSRDDAGPNVQDKMMKEVQ